MLTATQHWRWFYDQKLDRLCLSLDDKWNFVTACQAKYFMNNAEVAHQFNSVECAYYMDAVETLQATAIRFTDAQIMQIALNATAWSFFCKALSPKSWLVDGGVGGLELERLVSIVSSGNRTNAFVLERDNGFVSCLLLAKQTQLKSAKILPQFHCTKVKEDNLWPHSYPVETSQIKTRA